MQLYFLGQSFDPDIYFNFFFALFEIENCLIIQKVSQMNALIDEWPCKINYLLFVLHIISTVNSRISKI